MGKRDLEPCSRCEAVRAVGIAPWCLVHLRKGIPNDYPLAIGTVVYAAVQEIKGSSKRRVRAVVAQVLRDAVKVTYYNGRQKRSALVPRTELSIKE